MGKKQMDVHYVNVPVPYLVEENFGGCFHDQDDFTLAQILQDQPNALYQETVYQSLQRNSQIDTTRSSSTTLSGDSDERQKSHGIFCQTVNAESQLSLDEAYARELQALENQISISSLNQTSASGTDVTHVHSSTASSQGSSSSNSPTQAAGQDDVDPDNMTYEELQSLGDTIGTANRGLSDELISYLPVSTYKTGLFSRREKHDECVICCMTYKNRDSLITLPCQHHYHKSCITRWLKINKACPVCNEEVFGS